MIHLCYIKWSVMTTQKMGMKELYLWGCGMKGIILIDIYFSVIIDRKSTVHVHIHTITQCVQKIVYIGGL